MGSPFDPQPPVERHPSWAKQVLAAPAAGPITTVHGDVINECALCLAGDAHPNSCRPYRAMTTLRGTALCYMHFDQEIGPDWSPDDVRRRAKRTELIAALLPAEVTLHPVPLDTAQREAIVAAVLDAARVLDGAVARGEVSL